MSDWQNQLSKLVYTTEEGKVEDKKPAATIIGEAFSDGFLRIQRQTKGRKGKGVCIVTGVELPEGEFKQLAQILKKKCGKGGSVKEGTIEIQGDDREQIKCILESLGYKCKLAGG